VGIAKNLYVGANANVAGTLGVTGVATFSAAPIYSSLTASSAVATDASKALVSVTNTGTGNNVLATSPTLVTPILGTPTSGSLVNCTDTNYTGFKNRIINGAMVIDQRNAGAAQNNLASGWVYTVDRWEVYSNNSSRFNSQQNKGSVTPPTGFKNYLGVSVNTGYSVGASDYNILAQPIEGFNTADLGFGASGASSVNLSFWVYTSVTGTHSGFLSNSTLVTAYPFTFTVSSANTWTQISVSITGSTSGTWIGATNGIGLYVGFNLGNGSNFQGTANAWNSSAAIQPTGSVSVVATSSATFYITGVQLEKGSTATSFDYRPYTTELQLCQRYLPAYRATAGNWRFPAACVCGATNQIYATVVFPVTTRTNPTGVTVSAAADVTGGVDGLVANTAFTSVTFGFGSTQAARILGTTATSPFTAGQSAEIELNNGGYLYFTGCEL
jgi:hypothetical protein